MLSTLATLGPLAWKGFKFINDKTDGKFGKYLGGKAVELGAYATKKLLNKVNNEKANNIAKKVGEVAVNAATELTGEDSDITKNVTKAANIISPGLASPTFTIEQSLNMVDNVPYSKHLYGSNFQRYTPRTINKVKIMRKSKRHGRILQDRNE